MGFEDEDHHAHGENNGIGLTVTLAATLSLIGVVLLIIILHLYAKYLLRRQHRRRHHDILYRIRTQIAPTNVSSLESPNSGLDPVIIASLPKILYKQTDQFKQGEVMECSVCLGIIVEDAAVRVLPNCKHMFHVDCVDMWFNSNSTCPVCRTVAEPKGHDNLAIEVQPTAPPVEDGGVSHSQDPNHELEKVVMGCSGLRIASFPRMVISGERSLRRNQSYDGSDAIAEIEKQ